MLSSQMFNSSPLHQTEFSKIFDHVNTAKFYKTLVIFMESQRPDPRFEAMLGNSGLVFGVLNIFSNNNAPEVPDELVFSISRLSETLMLILANLPDAKQITSPELAEIFEKVPITAKKLLFDAKPIGEESDEFQLSFKKIYESLIESQKREIGTLLLYTLLHENINFRTYVLRLYNLELDQRIIICKNRAFFGK